jgi:PAS domain S-box-containing protein
MVADLKPSAALPAFYQSIAENAPMPMVVLGEAEHTVRYVNPAFCRLVRKKREELIGRPFLEAVPELDGWLALLDRVYRTGEPETHVQHAHTNPNPFYWSYAMWPVSATDEHPAGVMVQVIETALFHQQLTEMNEAMVLAALRQQEITEEVEREKNEQLRAEIVERKRAEEALQNLNAGLEARIADRTADLRRSIAERERLQDQLLQAQKMESVGTLASGVAHDFNNLLNIILSYATIMRLDGKNPASLAEGTAVIEETVSRGASLVQQLMSLGRKRETRFEPVRLNSVAEKLANLVTETFIKTIIITLDLEPGLPVINGDENQLHQTLLNLCVNARDAMPDGGRISLKTETVSGEELRRRLPKAEAERYALISVSDSGSGMDEATQRRIFEPFFTSKPVGQGTGLGLAVVYGVVQNHGGFIEVKSQLGHGTTFCIYLPIPYQTAEQTSETAPNDVEQKRGRGETILFVDDEVRQLKAMRRFLESEGYRVLIAKNGVEALETFKQHKDAIAVTVLDLGLPQLGGWQAFQQMREIRPELKALIATGLVSAEVEAEIAQNKLCGVIVKPYQPADLLNKISQAIHHTGENSR